MARSPVCEPCGILVCILDKRRRSKIQLQRQARCMNTTGREGCCMNHGATEYTWPLWTTLCPDHGFERFKGIFWKNIHHYLSLKFLSHNSPITLVYYYSGLFMSRLTVLVDPSDSMERDSRPCCNTRFPHFAWHSCNKSSYGSVGCIHSRAYKILVILFRIFVWMKSNSLWRAVKG